MNIRCFRKTLKQWKRLPGALGDDAEVSSSTAKVNFFRKYEHIAKSYVKPNWVLDVLPFRLKVDYYGRVLMLS